MRKVAPVRFRPGVVIGETEIGLRPSAGCATAPTDGTDSATLLRIADERMYRAKSSPSAAIPIETRATPTLNLDG